MRNGDALVGAGRRAAEEWQATRKRVVVQIADDSRKEGSSD
jgi:hypothetical protein